PLWLVQSAFTRSVVLAAARSLLIIVRPDRRPWHDTLEERAMTASWPPDPVREGQLEEVLGDYMQSLDRGETVDREQILAGHPDLADQLRSYFAGSDELEQLRQQAWAGPQAECRSRDASRSSQPSPAAGGGQGGGPRRVGDYELLEQIGQGGMGVVY